MPSIPSTVNLGSCISGIPVTLHYSFFLLLLLEVVYAVRYTYGPDPYPLYLLYVVVLYGPVLLLTVVAHEFGHALMTKRLGGSVDGIVLWPLGGFAICGPVESIVGDLKVSLAGPVTHVPMGLVWWCIWAGLSRGKLGVWPSYTIYLDVLSNSAAGFFEMISAQALYLNIVLFCFNLLLPAYPLDGGRVYASLLILVLKLKSITAAKVTAITALLISTGMILYSMITIFRKDVGSDVLLGVVGCFVLHQGHELYVAAKTGNLSMHPIFGRECYKDGDDGDRQQTEGGAEGGGTEEVAAGSGEMA